ncbi:hypothetical protein [Archangium lipolyticum]|uniref:hypothetical protein n=1 Tax=Archangium lipolyticum TaxID=2970465 RepID=UPI00214A2D68|nr:hypothetical protein [Archangium lipolyticum]
MAGLRRGLLAGLLGASLSAQAMPPPPPMPQRVAEADVIVLGEVKRWKRTSWFWQSEKTYVGTVRVERVFKGSALGTEVEVEIHVDSAGTSGGLSGEPRTGQFTFFLVRGEGGRYGLSSPHVYGFQILGSGELAQLESALRESQAH